MPQAGIGRRKPAAATVRSGPADGGRRLARLVAAAGLSVALCGSVAVSTTAAAPAPAAVTVAVAAPFTGPGAVAPAAVVPPAPAVLVADTSCAVGSVHFAKTKFLLHAGLAFGAFHRYLYKPFRSGILQAPVRKKLAALAKGAVAALFVYHELKIASKDANADKTLCKLVAPLGALGAKFTALRDKLKGGQVGASDFEGAQSSVTELSSQSSSLGAAIKDRTPPPLG
jgi:hypothetical protein